MELTKFFAPDVPALTDGTEAHSAAVRIEKELEELHSVFYPRRTWATPAARDNAKVLQVLLLVNLLRKTGEVRLRVESAPFSRLQNVVDLRSRLRSKASDEYVLASQECARRRGSHELKDQSWAAYRALRRQCPGHGIYLDNGLLHFCWVAPQRRAAITAGNMEDDRALETIAELRLKSFGVIGRARSLGEGPTGSSAVAWTLTTLEFSDIALNALRQLFQREYADADRLH